MQKNLTQAAIAKLRPGDYLADTHMPGLRVEAHASRRSFVYRYREAATGRLRQVKIGDAGKMAIADAREAVKVLRLARKDGNDPQSIVHQAAANTVAANVHEAATEAYTIRALIDAYAVEHLAKTKRGSERERTMRYDLAKWYRREAAAVKRKDVKALLTVIAERAPDMAGRVLRDLRAAYRHALDQERIPDGADPTHGVKAPKESRYVPRDRAFTEGEWSKWFAWLPQSGMSGDVQDALRMVAFTAARPGEAMAAVWRDIDLKGGTWVIRQRKREASHLVYLSKPAIALLARRDRGSEFVFPSPSRRDRPMREHALVWAITEARKSCPLAHWTAHDLRRSAATRLGDLGYSTDLIARVLGHYSIRRPTDIYVRSTRDVEAKKAWCELGDDLAKLGRTAPVVAIARRRSAS